MMNSDLGLDTLRTVGMRLVVGLIVALAATTALLVLALGAPGKWPAAALALLLAIYPVMVLLGRRTDAAARLMVSITVVAMPGLLLFVSEGHVWQTDLHMLFFALLAAASILCDWKALAAATVVVAVHHLGFGLIVPQWVFSGDGSFGRIAFHAVVLIVEAATLIWVAQGLVALLEANKALGSVTMLLADGKDAVVPFCDRNDELGGIARAVDHFRRVAVERATTDAAAASDQAIIVSALAEGLAAMARGDMTAQIRIDFPPAYDLAKQNFTAATSTLRHMIQAVVQNAGSIRTGTGEIAQATEDLARRTESSAASLEQTSAALVQIDDRLKTTTAGAIDTVERATQAIATVSNGRSTAEQAVAAMRRVSTSAKGIDSVIEGVDKIAFQTRVLAMNAAVEAGRAGDAGRGFAVVADLVSALAMRAEDEAKRARNQLSVTQAEIITAVSAVQRVDGSLAEIAGDVEAVHGLLETIAGDNRAQSLAVTEITVAIASLDRATQQNAAMVEETSAATRTLTTEVGELATAANAFKFERREQDIQPIVERRSGVPQSAAIVARSAPRLAAPNDAKAGSQRSAVAGRGAADWSDF